MYNYVGFLFDLVLFAAFFWDLSLGFPPFWNFLIMVAMYWENKKIGCRVEAAAVKLVRMSLSIVPQDRQDIPLSHTSHLHLHRHNRLPPSKSCECLKKEGATICWKYWKVYKLWLGRMETRMAIIPSYQIFSEPSLPVSAILLILWTPTIG